MKKIIALVLSSLFLWSCNNQTKKATTNLEADTQHEYQHNNVDEAIELNNGEKWLVNEEMKPFVLKGEELVKLYIQQNETDYNTLAEQLKEQNEQLIKSCTMNGKSHDELHKWLHPHLELVKELENETNTTTAHEIIVKIQNSFKDYHQYFK